MSELSDKIGLKIYDLTYKVTAFQLPDEVESFFNGNQLVVCMGNNYRLIQKLSSNINMMIDSIEFLNNPYPKGYSIFELAHINDNIYPGVYSHNASDSYYCNSSKNENEIEKLCNLCHFDDLPLLGTKIEVFNLTYMAEI